jgi:hypothetical protein
MGIGYDLYLYFTYTEEGDNVTPAMVAAANQVTFIQDLVNRQGYNMRHAKWLAGIVYPTPAQERARNARKAKKAGKKNAAKP